VSDADLSLMRRIDELHLERPFMGARMLRRQLRQEDIKVGRRHIATLIKKMGVEALYLKAYDSVSAARADIAEYLHWYNTGRSHSSLSDATPEQAYLDLLPKLAEAA